LNLLPLFRGTLNTFVPPVGQSTQVTFEDGSKQTFLNNTPSGGDLFNSGLAFGTLIPGPKVKPSVPRGTAGVGNASSTNYRETFFDAHPGTQGNVVVHHGVEQQVLKRFPGRFTEAEIHSLENLRGVPKSINSDVHLSKIRKEWNRFYKNNSNATRQQILNEATRIDSLLGGQFDPPL